MGWKDRSAQRFDVVELLPEVRAYRNIHPHRAYRRFAVWNLALHFFQALPLPCRGSEPLPGGSASPLD
jgi:hypothetical protein